MLCLAIQAEDCGGDDSHRTNEEVLAQHAPPAGGPELDGLQRLSLVGQDLLFDLLVDLLDRSLPQRFFRRTGSGSSLDQFFDCLKIMTTGMVVCNDVPAFDIQDLLCDAHVRSIGVQG